MKLSCRDRKGFDTNTTDGHERERLLLHKFDSRISATPAARDGCSLVSHLAARRRRHRRRRDDITRAPGQKVGSGAATDDRTALRQRRAHAPWHWYLLLLGSKCSYHLFSCMDSHLHAAAAMSVGRCSLRSILIANRQTLQSQTFGRLLAQQTINNYLAFLPITNSYIPVPNHIEPITTRVDVIWEVTRL